MHVSAVACIYDRHWCYLTGILGCSLDEMAHGDNIGIIAYHQDGILEGLTLGGTGCLGIRETNDTGTGQLDMDMIFSIMTEEKGNQKETLKINTSKLKKYFPKNTTPKQMEETIIKLLERELQRKRNRDSR